MAVKCPKCQAENPDTVKFCGECGTQLPSSEEIPVSPTKTFKPDKLEDKLERIGNYKLLEVIGKGGMGTVYLAQQEKPIRRKVALKVIKPGMDSKEIVARFESEQQALALMSHPNIAQVYDSGTTEQGYPYFVMEYVPGLSITEYCDKNKMTTQERLKLFEKICHAIQHAHYKGIVHRDLKPSNILVTYQDNKHIPKIIDFGIAKALTGQGLTEKTLHTSHGVAIGTPVYMSPEQAELTGYDIDTRTDVYSLGVLLYELLVGVTPFGEKELEKAGFMEILRIIREEEPPRPSTRFGSLGDTSKEIAKKRSTNEIGMEKQLKGDLDWIVMKAIDKDKQRRYSSAAELATDIERYLYHEPIQAHPPSIFYKTKKYIQRNKVKSLAIVILMFSIFVSLSLYIIFLNWSIKEKRKTDYNFALALKEKAKSYAEKNQWQLVKLYYVNSLLYQAKSQKYLPMDDIKLPFEYRDWLLKHNINTRRFGYASKKIGVLSPNWKYMAASTEDKIHIFNISSGKRILTLKEDLENVTSIDFSPDEKYLALGGRDKIIKIWDISSGDVITTLKGHDEGINSLSFSPDGKYLVSGSGDKTIKIWEVPNGKKIANLKGHESAVRSVRFSPDGMYLVSLSKFNKIIKIWKIASGKEIVTIKNQISLSDDILSFSPDGTLLTTITNRARTIKIWEVSSGKEIVTLNGHTDEIQSLCFSPDGRLLASGSNDDTIKLWDVSSGIEIATLSGHESAVRTVNFSPDGRYLASGGNDRTVRIWRISSESEIATLIGNDEQVRSVVFSPDGKQLYSESRDRPISSDRRSKILIWESSYDKRTTILETPSSPEFLRFSPDNKNLTAGFASSEVITWDVSTAKVKNILRGYKGRAITTVCFSPDWKYFASDDRFKGEIKLWEVSSGKKVVTIKGHWFKGIPYLPMSFSPDGRFFVTGDSDKTIKVWEFPSGKKISTLKGHDDGIFALSFSPDGKYLASAANGKIIKIWDISSGEVITTLKGRENCLLLRFSPDNKYIASRNADATINIWEVIKGKEISTFTLKWYSSEPYGWLRNSLSFSPDGKYLASGGLDETIKIWKAPEGIGIITLVGHKTPISSLCFSYDGSYLASGSSDRIIKIWDFGYFINSLRYGLDYPYKVKDVKKLMREVEKQTGFTLDALTPVPLGSVIIDQD